MDILLNPKRHSRAYPDERSREVMRKTIEFFEQKGKRKLKADYHAQGWYADFLDPNGLQLEVCHSTRPLVADDAIPRVRFRREGRKKIEVASDTANG